MQKGIKYSNKNLVLSFLDCFQNCWPPTAVHKCDPIIRLISTPLRMCRGIGMYVYRSGTGILLVIIT